MSKDERKEVHCQGDYAITTVGDARRAAASTGMGVGTDASSGVSIVAATSLAWLVGQHHSWPNQPVSIIPPFNGIQRNATISTNRLSRYNHVTQAQDIA